MKLKTDKIPARYLVSKILKQVDFNTIQQSILKHRDCAPPRYSLEESLRCLVKDCLKKNTESYGNDLFFVECVKPKKLKVCFRFSSTEIIYFFNREDGNLLDCQSINLPQQYSLF